MLVKYYGIPKQDVNTTSTEAEYLYPIQLCISCGNILHQASTALCVGACCNCAKPNAPIYCGNQYKADWITRTIKKLPTVNKRMLIRSIYECDKLRTFIREVNSCWKGDYSRGKGFEYWGNSRELEPIQEETIEHSNTGTEGGGKEAVNTGSNCNSSGNGREATNFAASSKTTKLQNSIRQKLLAKGLM